MNKKKLLTIGILPLMWFLYFIFELVTGRINDTLTLIGNILFLFLFAFVGLIIYYLGDKYKDGFSFKNIYIIFFILMLIDQGGKIIIKFFFFEEYIPILNGFLSFNPIINTDGSWLNARFDTGVNFSLLILINIIALILFTEIYRYYRYNGKHNFWSDMSYLFLFAGALCSLIDKVFYGGSLDFIGVSDLFIADIKDIYINLGILMFVLTLYHDGVFSEEDNSTLKDDYIAIKKFFSFVIKDIKRNITIK